MTLITDDMTVTALLHELSNWGRWGNEDRLGTVNLITDEVRRQATASVRHGVSVDLSRAVSPKATRGVLPAGAMHFMTMTGTEAPRTGKGVTTDWFGMPIHGFEVTHLDALSHVLWDSQSYNGIEGGSIEVTHGATDGGVDVAVGKLVTRGVLLDIPHVRGIEHLPPGAPIMPEDLESAEQAAGLEVSSGDALIVRTGCDTHVTHRESLGKRAAGLHASCLPWLHERGVALLVSDATNDVRPSGFLMDSPVHIIGITAMGLWLVDNALLETLSETCAHHKQWDMLFVVSPLKLKNSTGSPVSPIAIL